MPSPIRSTITALPRWAGGAGCTPALAMTSCTTASTAGSFGSTGVTVVCGISCQFGDSTHRPSGSALSAARGWTVMGHVGDISSGANGRTCTLNCEPTKFVTPYICAGPCRSCGTGSP